VLNLPPKATHLRRNHGNPDYVVLIADHSEKALDVQGGAMNSGAFLQQWTEMDNPNQQFNFEDLGDAFCKITARHSGKVLDVAQASTAEGARIIRWDWHGGNNQRFVLENGGDNPVLRAKHSGLVLDVAGASMQDGAVVQQWKPTGGANQRWTVKPYPPIGQTID
jgi:hypothetical protein